MSVGDCACPPCQGAAQGEGTLLGEGAPLAARGQTASGQGLVDRASGRQRVAAAAQRPTRSPGPGRHAPDGGHPLGRVCGAGLRAARAHQEVRGPAPAPAPAAPPGQGARSGPPWPEAA
jgi:hypothetical protein